MNINNPTSFSPPDLTLTTANSSGNAGALRADDSILVYDTTLPDAITFGQSGATGSAATSARRDHAHQMASETTTMIGCLVYNASNVSIAHGTHTTLAMPNEYFDTDTMHDTTTNNSRITCKTAGTYMVWGGIDWQDATSGERVIYLRKNGATDIGKNGGAPSVSGRTTPQVVATVQLAVDDYVELRCYQSEGSALISYASDDYAPNFGALKIGSS
mgnify:CR=1 FL=1